jgi:hypothetical protein
MPKEVGMNRDEVQEKDLPSDTELEEMIKQWADEGIRKTSDDEYMRFLMIFGGVFLSNNKKAKMDVMSTKMLSTYMPRSLESFALMLYCNTYWKNMREHWKLSATTKEQNGEEDLSSVTVDTSFGGGSKTLFTSDSRGSAKYDGWSHEGLTLYNNIYRVLGIQREKLITGAIFEKKMLATMRKKNSGSKRKHCEISVNNDINELEEIMNQGG